jgi:hypothetical protein
MMTVDDQRIIAKIVASLPDNAVIVEFGGGGSTLMFANLLRMRQSLRLITIEHNVEWYHKIKKELEQIPDANDLVQLHLRTPDADASVWPFGHYYEETPYACADYIHASNVDIPWKQVECVLVDGFVRGAVLATLATKVNSGITVMVHDYPGREDWYDWAVRLYDVVQPPSGKSPGYTPEGSLYDNSLLVMRSR